MRELRVQEADFDVGQEYAALAALGDGAGAIALFVGRVRDSGDLQQVRELRLEHYPGMTEKAMQAVVDEAAGRWPLLGVRIVHRIGALAPGAQIVLVGVAAAHREAAFAACEFLMDYLKTRAPFWKQERSGDGSARWVDQKAQDLARAARWAPGPSIPGTGQD